MFQLCHISFFLRCVAFIPTTDRLLHYCESTGVVCSAPALHCLQAPWLVQQLCLCGYAKRRPRHPTEARVNKRNGDRKGRRWASVKSVQSLNHVVLISSFSPAPHFSLTIKASVTLDVDFQGRNSSNSSRYDCNPVSTAVTHSSIEPFKLTQISNLGERKQK